MPRGLGWSQDPSWVPGLTVPPAVSQWFLGCWGNRLLWRGGPGESPRLSAEQPARSHSNQGVSASEMGLSPLLLEQYQGF